MTSRALGTMTNFGPKKDTGQNENFESDIEMDQRIIQQAEFYLSEDYLMKNAYLLRQVARKRNGFLSIKFISSFKRMRELSPDWQTTARALAKSEKLELSEDGMKVRRKLPLTPFISSIKSIKSVLVTSSEELTVSGITAWLSNYGEIVYVQVIKPGMEIPDNLRVYSTKHSELGNRPVGVVEFDTPEAAHRCCRELDSGTEGEARVCLLGTRIRSFARHRRKKEAPRYESNNLVNQKGSVNKERLSPSDSSTDSAISDGSSSQDGSLPRDSNGSSQWNAVNRASQPFAAYGAGYTFVPATQQLQTVTQQQRKWESENSTGQASSLRNSTGQTQFNLEQLRGHQQQLFLQEKLLQAARMQYQNALYLAHQRTYPQNIHQQRLAQLGFFPKNSYAAPPPGLEPESEVSDGFTQSIHSWLEKLSVSD